MTLHKTAALYLVFLGYREKHSPSGPYYVFDVVDADGSHDVCRLDAIHRNAVDWLFDSLDKGESAQAPVIRDHRVGYRIDLTAAREIKEARRAPAPPNKPLPPVRTYSVSRPAPTAPPRPLKTPGLSPRAHGKTRVQFTIETEKYEFLRDIAKAQGYESHTDCLRNMVDRLIEATQAAVRSMETASAQKEEES